MTSYGIEARRLVCATDCGVIPGKVSSTMGRSVDSDAGTAKMSRVALFTILAPAFLLIFGYVAWSLWGAKHLQIDNLDVTPQPPWIRADVVREVFEGSNLSDLTTLDHQATPMVAHAFDSHPWVRRAIRVQKLAGGKIKVDVEYREPIAMVFYDKGQGDSNQANPQLQFLPVDQDGVLLPSADFTPDQVLDFLIIYAPGAAPMGLVGHEFGDVRIHESVKLCKLLAPLRRELRLERIYVDDDPRNPRQGNWLFEIGATGRGTTPGRRFVWGHAPGKETRGEPSADRKLARLIDEVHHSHQANSSELSTVFLNTPESKPVSFGP